MSEPAVQEQQSKPDYARPRSFTYRLTAEDLIVLRQYSQGILPDKAGRMALKALVRRLFSDVQQRGFFVCAHVEKLQ